MKWFKEQKLWSCFFGNSSANLQLNKTDPNKTTEQVSYQ